MEAKPPSEILARVKSLLSASIMIQAEDMTPLVSVGQLDSFNLVNLIVELEKTFTIKIPDDEMSAENFETPTAIAQLCQRRIGG